MSRSRDRITFTLMDITGSQYPLSLHNFYYAIFIVLFVGWHKKPCSFLIRICLRCGAFAIINAPFLFTGQNLNLIIKDTKSLCTSLASGILLSNTEIFVKNRFRKKLGQEFLN